MRKTLALMLKRFIDAEPSQPLPAAFDLGLLMDN
jgi:hypothetical protein